MPECQRVTHLLLPAGQHAPAAIPPPRRARPHPPACPATGLLRERLGLFPPGPEVGRAAEGGQQRAPFSVGIALAQTPPLGGVRGGLRPRPWDPLEGLPRQRAVRPRRARHGHSAGPAPAVGEAAALGAARPASGRVLAHRFAPHGGRWSSPHPPIRRRDREDGRAARIVPVKQVWPVAHDDLY